VSHHLILKVIPPSAQTTTAHIRRNKDHVFNDARMILTQRQLDFYVQRGRNLALVCGSVASCISTKQVLSASPANSDSRFSIVFDTRPVRTLVGPPAVLRWFPSDAPSKTGHHRFIPHYHPITQYYRGADTEVKYTLTLNLPTTTIVAQPFNVIK